RAEIELTAAGGKLPTWELANIEGKPIRRTDADGTVHLSWSWEEIPEAPPDLPPPPPLLTTPYLAYSNHPDWGSLAAWYQRHVAPRLLASRQVVETAHRLTDGLKTRDEKIAALYRFVTDKIRYVALEFGEHRFRPFSADWVLRHRMGDCKDKAALLVSLLGTLKIPARMVLIRTADQGPVAVKMGLLSDFNHAIAYLPDEDRYLDGTATGHDPTRPPGPDQGAWSIVIDGPSSAPRTTPLVGSGEGRRTVKIAVPRGGRTATLSVTLHATGDAADRVRGAFAGSVDRQRFSRWLQRLFPSASLTADPSTSLNPGQDPATIKLVASVPVAVLASAPGLRAYPGRLALTGSLAPVARRTTPLEIPERPDLHWSLEVDLGRPPAPLPEDVHLDGPNGRLDLRFEATATGYTVTGDLHLEAGLVPAASYGALHDFLVRVDRELARRMEAPTEATR
ncbi:MAG TPA: transglutaminase domain-containing protein, partial [Acidobacteria bacterium]|nr:transglutaminase domain-containing protein [Acidobacteriota bacterium]